MTKFGIMLSANHAPSMNNDIVVRAFKNANKHGCIAIGHSEVYNVIPEIKKRPAWNTFVATSNTDRRRGPKDNPISHRKRSKMRTVKLVERKVYKACEASTPEKIAPERWTYIEILKYRGLLILVACVHLNANIMIAPKSERSHFAQDQMKKLLLDIKEFRRKYNLDAEFIVGDMNATKNWTVNPYTPASTFIRLGHRVWWDGILAISYRGVNLTNKVIIPPEQQGKGQDHNWLIGEFTA